MLFYSNLAFRRCFATLLVLAFSGVVLPAAKKATAPSCSHCQAWNVPQEPFRVFGNTYYVGTHGITSILVTSNEGHILMDGALAESVPQIVANIKALGFRIEDVKLIVNSHVHFDHAGGLAELQRLSGARVAASGPSAKVLSHGGVGRDDPQYGELLPIARVARVETLRDGQSFRVGDADVTAHLTPGHTPGGTSWTWKSCEGGRCWNMVYADSITAISAGGFRFTDSKRYPGAVKDFEKSFAFLSTAPCDVLLSTHPEISDLWARLDARKRGVQPDPFVDAGACGKLVGRARTQLEERLASERK